MSKRRLVARAPAESTVEATHLVLPPDTNAVGTAFGGRIMQWMDIAAAIAAMRHCGGIAVTVAVDDLHFANPIHLGDVVVVRARVNYAGTSSMEVGVRVEREGRSGTASTHCLSAYFTFVAVNARGRPIPVPPLRPETEDDRRRFANAEQRRKRRLALRG
jgi:acyl-CoA hydrolase